MLNNNINDIDSVGAYRRIKARNEKRMIKQKKLKLTVAGALILVVIIASLAKVISGSNDGIVETYIEQLDIPEVYGNESGTVDANGEKKKIIPYPTISKSYVEISSPTVKSPYTALLCVEDNMVIAGKLSNEKIYPASMTKVMTLIVAVENLKNLDATFEMKNEILIPLVKENATRAGFDPGEIVSARDMLYGLILPSGADASIGLAMMVSGSEVEFAKLMNKKCEELGLKNTHFTNSSGLHNADQYTTSIEMAMIFDYAMKNEICAKVLSTEFYTTAPTEFHPKGISLTSTMFSRMYGTEAKGVTITAGKVGYTDEAKSCLVSYAVSNGKHYVLVTANASNKWHVIFDNFEIYGNYIN